MAKRLILMALVSCLVLGSVFAQQKAKDYIAQGQDQLKQGNYAEAVAAFESAIKLEPKNKQAATLLNDAKLKRMEEAFTQAQKLQQEGKFQEAITLYNSAIRYAPAGYNTRNIQNRRDEAQKALALTEQQEQNAISEKEQQAQQQANSQTTKERQEQSQQAVKKANELLIGGKYPEAIAQYEAAIAEEGLTKAETTETNRLINEAKALQEEMVKFNRPLQDSDFEVAQNGNIITITKYKASTSKTITVAGASHTVYFGILNVVIPLKVFGVPLSLIGNEAFKNCGLQSVVIPDTVTEIGYGAFANNNLEKVTLGKGLKAIKGGVTQGSVEVSELGAFEGNKPLTEIVIPDVVTEIGARAFKDCGLKRVIFGKMVQIIGESAFRNNQLPDVSLQASVRSIRRFAFHQNQIKNLFLPNGVAEIYDEAFTNNPMESVVIPASLAGLTPMNNMQSPRIGGYNAKYTASAPLTFPNSLIMVTFPGGVHDDNLTTFEQSLRDYYISNKKAPGVYIKNGPVWTFKR
ncbi:MAG: leucine-rich repeat protein [Spirochaetes bacterium]|nr:leucine-rich repeat protein [Spirochaetota bacterium]